MGTKKKGSTGAGPSIGPVQLNKRPLASVDEEEERRKKQKRDEKEREEEEERQEWMRQVKKKGFTCERQVDRTKLGPHDIIQVISNQGLDSFFDEIKGFKKGVVRKFYMNMVVHRKEKKIVSTIGSKTVTVTIDSIASYLKFERPEPSDVTYPKGWSCDDEVLQTPNLDDGATLFVFSKGDEKVDWANWIWNVMMDFRVRGAANANIPFPAMVTKFCDEAGVKADKGDEEAHFGCPRAITAVTEKKSKSKSKPPRPETIISSMPSGKKRVNRWEQYLSIIKCQGDVILENQCQMDKRVKRLEKGVSTLKRWMRWWMDRVGESSNNPYVPTEEDNEADTEEAVVQAGAAED
ncbi:hypothetical protein RHGRI_019290 [Rhododendron griersonianum]|uniref:Uncharacterized protein n=1 Tax=Rhododendron griersonianum TaxID=479676 RepID=A0AAV6JC28_9ERIC|nr:hypothetical protein RHGRI_019290 [Rhododendron griersonianum]